MAEHRLGRSEYYFDPTATTAVARADRTIHKPLRDHESGGDIYHASRVDPQTYQGHIFEPDRPITPKQVARGRRRLEFRQLYRLQQALRWAENNTTEGGE